MPSTHQSNRSKAPIQPRATVKHWRDPSIPRHRYGAPRDKIGKQRNVQAEKDAIKEGEKAGEISA